MMKSLWIVFLIPLAIGCRQVDSNIVYQSKNLIIKQLTESTWVHISYIQLASGVDFPCNGMIYADSGEAIVFDTPTTNEVAEELLTTIVDSFDFRVIGVVVNHFHVDCLGGLRAFHDRGIPSYGNSRTITLAKQDSVIGPSIGFDTTSIIRVGKNRVFNQYLGPGHTTDNIVSYIPSDRVLFGGCMIKAVGAGKGNLKDADVKNWSISVQSIQEHFKTIDHVVPGHGEPGDTQLLEYTIDMFSEER